MVTIYINDNYTNLYTDGDQISNYMMMMGRGKWKTFWSKVWTFCKKVVWPIAKIALPVLNIIPISETYEI